MQAQSVTQGRHTAVPCDVDSGMRGERPHTIETTGAASPDLRTKRTRKSLVTMTSIRRGELPVYVATPKTPLPGPASS